MNAATDSIAPLRQFVVAMTRLADRLDRPDTLSEIRELLKTLIARDDWLPDACAQPHPEFYQQYLLHCDPLERFSVVSFVWGPGQRTPIHNHGVWGFIGMLRGAERGQRYISNGGAGYVAQGDYETLEAGDIDFVSPSTGDWHVVENALSDRPSISIHVYGANIGAVRRQVYDPAGRQLKPFVSGYSLDSVPNLWDRSHAVRTAP